MANIALTRKYSTFDAYWADVQTFMIDVGWTLHDDVDASNKVYKTNGVESNYPYIYIKLTKGVNKVSMILYLYWNNSTHVGSVNAYYSATYNSVSYLSTYEMGLIGNEDSVSLINYAGYYGATFGFCSDLFYSGITTISGAVSAGDYVDLPVVDTTVFTVGQNVQIVGIDYEGRDPLIISDVQGTTHVTVENLPRNYASGAFIGVSPCPAVSNCGSSTKDRFYPLCHRSVAGTTNGASAPYMTSITPITVSSIDPDLSTGFYGLTIPYLYITADSVIGQLNFDGMCKHYSGAVTRWDVFAVINSGSQPDQGTATSVTNITLTDTAKTWVVNELANRYVVITEETGIGQSRKILSNTIDTMTVVAWDTNPSIISVYRICDKVYRYWNNYLLFLQDREEL